MIVYVGIFYLKQAKGLQPLLTRTMYLPILAWVMYDVLTYVHSLMCTTIFISDVIPIVLLEMNWVRQIDRTNGRISLKKLILYVVIKEVIYIFDINLCWRRCTLYIIYAFGCICRSIFICVILVGLFVFLNITVIFSFGMSLFVLCIPYLLFISGLFSRYSFWCDWKVI